jgi:hypothetical protein
MSSTTLPDVAGLSLSSADRLCDDCSNMGNEIRQLCEDEDFTISKPRASVDRNRLTCAFCGMIASRFWYASENEGDFIISNDTKWRNEDPRPTDGIDTLIIMLERPRPTHLREIELAVLTTEG